MELNQVADYLADAGLVWASRETVRQILHAGGVRWQAEMIGAYIRWRNARAQPKDQLRPELSHSHLDRLPDQRCLTRHWPLGRKRPYLAVLDA